MNGPSIAERVASRFHSRFLRHYTLWKVRTDPVYEAVARELTATRLLTTDLGCGIGVLAIYLEECGLVAPIRGIDHDADKIEAARLASAGSEHLEFFAGDARDPLSGEGNVVMLDVLHYFGDEEQSAILRNIAGAVAPGGMLVLREGIRDGSLRYRLTWVAELAARASGWLKAGRINFPTMGAIMTAFPSFESRVVPLWGATPFNNYLFVFRRPLAGTTKE